MTGVFGVTTAIVATELANRKAEFRERLNREADMDRERLRDLRGVIDDASLAMVDPWGILAVCAYAMPLGDPAVSRRSPIEARDPDPQAYIEAFERLRALTRGC